MYTDIITFASDVILDAPWFSLWIHVNQLLLLICCWFVVDCLRVCEAVGDSLTCSTDINLPSLLHLTFLYYFYALCDALRPILLSSKEMDIWKLRWIQQMLLHLDESLYVVEDYWCCDSHGLPWRISLRGGIISALRRPWASTGPPWGWHYCQRTK